MNIDSLNLALERLSANPQEYLKTSELEDFAEYAPFAMWVKDCHDCDKGREPTLLYINPAYTRIWGVTPDEYIGKPDSAIWPKEVAAQMRAHDIKVYLAQSPISFWENLPIPKYGRADTYNLKWPINGGRRIAGINLILPEHGLERNR